MIRRSFLKRMALAAAACAFIDVPWPKQWEPIPGPFIVEPRSAWDIEMAAQMQDYLNWTVRDTLDRLATPELRAPVFRKLWDDLDEWDRTR